MSTSNPQLIPGCEERQAFRFPERHDEMRWNSPLMACQRLAADMAARITASKDSFPWQFFRGDCHSHTQHSDGIGTVTETAEMVRHADLDFQFVTDHWGVTQKDECIEHGLWYGQEPPTQLHHMGILGLEYAFEPQMDFFADLAAAEAEGATVFVPHPTGWWPATVYSEEQKKVLEELPDPFLMEICNGCNNIVSAFDYTDDSAIELWDYLLCSGKTVHAMGNTDAHLPHAIGIVWNGVFADRCDQETILAELRQGHSFVSDAPLIYIAMGEARMGDRASRSDREHKLKVTVVDSRGLNSVAIIADGEEIFYQHLRGETIWSSEIAIPENITKYVRAEAFAHDAKRAYTNPIYL